MSNSGETQSVAGEDWRLTNQSDGKAKLGERVARAIEREIVEAGWPVGEMIGSEAELQERFGVSRAVLREAIRMLEQHGVARTRRGPGGGLIVMAPDLKALVRAAALTLTYNRTEPAHVFETRIVLELAATQLAAERIDEAGIETLRDALQRESEAIETAGRPGTSDVHYAIGQLTGNPAITLFLEVLIELTNEIAPETVESHVREPIVTEETHHAHERIVEAIVASDIGLAQHRMRVHLDAMRKFLQE
jgi:DNA-binding FadR family transcriptional regulator